jgi:hypothetical protein
MTVAMLLAAIAASLAHLGLNRRNYPLFRAYDLVQLTAGATDGTIVAFV